MRSDLVGLQAWGFAVPGPLRDELTALTDPAEQDDLFAQQPAIATRLQTQLREWQKSVLSSLTGADYQ